MVSSHSLSRHLRQGRGETEPVGVARLSTVNNGSTLFCIPGIGNNLFDFKPLSEAGLDSSIVVLCGAPRSSIALPGNDVEPLARNYVDTVTRLQERGPYHIAGYSFGGIVAVELANQLLKRGELVGSVTLIDTIPSFLYGRIDSVRHPSCLLLVQLVLERLRLPEDKRCELYGRLHGASRNTVLAVLDEASKAEVDATLRGRIAFTLRAFAGEPSGGYRAPDRLGSLRIGKVKATRSFLPIARQLGVDVDPRIMRPDGAYGWEDILENEFDIIEVDASHSTIVKRPCVDTISQFINVRLRVPAPGDLTA
jgi:pimeloyl-ACP methyl ester carboxylesterase